MKNVNTFKFYRFFDFQRFFKAKNPQEILIFLETSLNCIILYKIGNYRPILINFMEFYL